MEESTRLRARAVLSSWLTVLVVVSLVVGAAGAWATYTAHVAPGTTTEQRTSEAWSASTEFDHAATVTRENPLYPVGTELSNRSTYFTAAAPVLDGTFTVTPRGLDSDVSVDLDATLVLVSADEGTTYWRDSRPLAESSASAADGPVSVAFSLNVTEVADRIAAIEDGIGSTPGETSAGVVVDARVAGTSSGSPSSLSFTRELSLGLAGDTYTATTSGATTEAVERTTTVEVPASPGPLRSIGGPLALVVGVVAAVGLGVAARREGFALDEAERARLDYLDDRAEFDEWIVAVDLPEPEPDVAVAEATSLADLVNLAIDSDAAVLEDPHPEAETFTVVTDGYRYTYRPPSADGTRMSRIDPLGDDGDTDDDERSNGSAGTGDAAGGSSDSPPTEADDGE